ncbi:hypothetical protein [Alteraurantiacibacter buctensis]|uniref:Uncharacterized protein n=1 Tax=Alteraurantiacibacter buctensis TaxID=1503981 RepID=A0A844YX17_9SPHN|nr:hypothetical protein [Alteraurantiacibacter buctensis]MXO72885.1 hypothetical protein [Alteraurantiacibacter buctensis]
MTGNRLAVVTRQGADGPAFFSGIDHMRVWCAERNRKARTADWPHWLYVSEDKETHALTIKSRKGSDALDVWKVISGWYPDFEGWDAERLASEFRILRHIAKMGLDDEGVRKCRFTNPPRMAA